MDSLQLEDNQEDSHEDRPEDEARRNGRQPQAPPTVDLMELDEFGA